MKYSFIKGMLLGVATGAAMGIIFDPMTKSEKKAIKRKLEKIYDDMMD